MNDKIKDLLSTAYKTDSIEKNKWRIENREQLREQRKKDSDKELQDLKKALWYLERKIQNLEKNKVCG